MGAGCGEMRCCFLVKMFCGTRERLRGYFAQHVPKATQKRRSRFPARRTPTEAQYNKNWSIGCNLRLLILNTTLSEISSPNIELHSTRLRSASFLISRFDATRAIQIVFS